MKSKIKYTDEPIGKLRIIKDFLPPPEELVFKEEPVKVTMLLNKSSVRFFKRQALKYHTPYQRIIRNLLDAYVAKHAV
jgi:predicted DNA binding CopG/RHH family protein